MTKYILDETELSKLLGDRLELKALYEGRINAPDCYEESFQKSDDWDNEKNDWNVTPYLEEFTKADDQDMDWDDLVTKARDLGCAWDRITYYDENTRKWVIKESLEKISLRTPERGTEW